MGICDERENAGSGDLAKRREDEEEDAREQGLEPRLARLNPLVSTASLISDFLSCHYYFLR
jgi:hypothetical protein